jgi:hypothetical protein
VAETQPSIPRDASDGGRQSIADGSAAQFEMTYSPPRGGRTKFGPPMRTRWPSALYLTASIVLAVLVLRAYLGAPTNSWLFSWVVLGDRHRPIAAGTLAAVILGSAVATVLRTHMRGILISDQWIEARYLLPLGLPRARRWAWPQVRRVVVDGERVTFELWDSTWEQMPEVARPRELVILIEEHARLRRIEFTASNRGRR